MVDDACKKGMLITAQKVSKEYESCSFEKKREILNKFKLGYVENPYFKHSGKYFWNYRIRANVSASEAIINILKCGQLYSNVAVATNIAYYLALLWEIQSVYGEVEGNKRFDALFGEKENITPKNRRLMLSRESMILDLERGLNSDPLPQQPLSFLNEVKEIKKIEDLKTKVRVGDFLIFEGDPSYKLKHPLGEHRFYCCIATSIDPFRVRIPNIIPNQIIGKEKLKELSSEYDPNTNELSPKMIYELHEAAFKKAPSFLSSQVYPKDKILKLKVSRKDIQGFWCGIVGWNQDAFMRFLYDDVENVIALMNNHLDEKIAETPCVQKEIIKAIEKLEIENSEQPVCQYKTGRSYLMSDQSGHIFSRKPFKVVFVEEAGSHQTNSVITPQYQSYQFSASSKSTSKVNSQGNESRKEFQCKK